MDICRLKPDYHTCCSCIDTQLDTGEEKHCDLCTDNSWVRLLGLGRTIFGRDYAYVTGPITDWTVKKVDIKRIGLCSHVNDEIGEARIRTYNKSIKELAERAKEQKESK